MGGTHLPALESVQLGTNVEEEVEGLSCLAFVLASIKVNDVLDWCSASVDNPVVTVKRFSVAQKAVEPGSWGQGGRVTSKGDKFGSSTSV